MSKILAVVLEKSGSRYTVLGRDGTFRQVHRQLNAEVGEEIQIQSWSEVFSGVRIWAGAVALFLVVLTSLIGWNLYQAPTAVALLSVDINPSLQFALDNQGNLLKFQTQNEDAKRMLSQIDLKGKPIQDVIKQIVTQAYDQKFLSAEQHWVVVGYSPMTDKTIAQMPKELNESQIISWVTEIGEKKGLTPQVAVFSLTSEERNLAQKRELTLGEYALWQTADKAGVVTQPEKLKDTSERVRLLEDPQVQVQIKAEKKKIEDGLPRKSGNVKQDSGSTNKPSENGMRKPLPVGKQFSPIKGQFPEMDKSRGQEGDQPKNQDINNSNDEDKQKQKQTAKDQEKQQNKERDKAKNSVNKEIERVKEKENVYGPVLAPIPAPGNLRYDTFPIYKIPERQEDEREMNDESGIEDHNDVDH